MNKKKHKINTKSSTARTVGTAREGQMWQSMLCIETFHCKPAESVVSIFNKGNRHM